MSYANRGELKTAIRQWLTEDNTDVLPDSIIEDAIGFVENDLNYSPWGPDSKLFRVFDMNAVKFATLLDSDPYVSLPEDFLSMRYVTEQDNDQPPLTYLTPRALEEKGSGVGYLRYYTIANKAMKVKTTPSGGEKLEMSYYEEIPPLDSDTATNWLLAKRPSIYLYGSLSHLDVYLDNDRQLAKVVSAYERQVLTYIDADTQAVTAAGALEIQPSARVA